jgi:CDP-diacylglycerol--glycerol-3-phosphate 3-phosphatidyltransferase
MMKTPDTMRHLPNALTILRMLVVPVSLWLLLGNGFWTHFWALVLFVLAALSDYVDGRLARTWQADSRLGRFLDPLADKLLVLGTFTALAVILPHQVPWWAVLLVALRDVAVTALRSWNEAQGRSVKTLYAAKVKTAVQLTYLIALLVFLAAAHLSGSVGGVARWVLSSPAPLVLLIGVVVVTLGTGALYFRPAQPPAL